MFVRIRKVTSEDNSEDIIVSVNKCTVVKHLKTAVQERFGVKPNEQKLFYSGKQLADNKKVLDYGVKMNDVVQLLVLVTKQENAENNGSLPARPEPFSLYYKVGDLVDTRCGFLGSWNEGTIVSIYCRHDISRMPANMEREKFFIFNVLHDTVQSYQFEDIRPRAYYVYKKSELHVGQKVMINYNFDDWEKRGYWYDMTIVRLNKKSITGLVDMGIGKPDIPECKSIFVDQVMRIERPALLTERDDDELPLVIPRRETCPHCWHCSDEPDVMCPECGCKICISKRNMDKMLNCDECDEAFHIYCLTPPLDTLPTEPWYCPTCKNDDPIVLPGNESAEEDNGDDEPTVDDGPSTSTGKGKNKIGGMTGAKRKTVCTIVPLNHYGPIPGIEVGMTWKFRMQVSEAGVHRPSMAGIHGRSTDGAYSLVLSGGYEDDIDNGDTIIYTGSGGRDLTARKQRADQTLTKMNLALAKNYISDDWEQGKPIRVLRSSKLASKFAPKDGIRYDGIYKVCEYYPEEGKSGYLVWRFMLKRCDTEPAPWEEGGQEYPVLYPPGYLESIANKENLVLKSGKRKKGSAGGPAPKKTTQPYKLSPELDELIKADVANSGYWRECGEQLERGKQYFLNAVTENFLCVCCRELVYNPVTTICKHNICQTCLQRSFDCILYNCSHCRAELGENYPLTINDNLAKALTMLFPGYGNQRQD